jgi:hypothetical protein
VDLVAEAIDIISRLSWPSADESINFACVHDALRLTELVERHKSEPVSPRSVKDLNDRMVFDRCRLLAMR